jgi:hypothetical protein
VDFSILGSGRRVHSGPSRNIDIVRKIFLQEILTHLISKML